MLSYLANLPPFAVVTKIYGKKTIYFHNITNGERYYTRGVSYDQKFLKGVSGGFLVFENMCGIWFSHPITGTTHRFHKPPAMSSSLCSSIILVQLFPDNDYLAVVLREGMIGVNHFGKWSMLSLSWAGKAIQVIDLAASKDSVLALTHKGSIANMVYSNSSPSFQLTLLKERRFKENSKLVISVEEEAMVVEFDYSMTWFQIFRADLVLKEWVIVRNLGNQALFIEETAVRLCDPRPWGGLPNHLYYLDTLQFGWSVSPLGDSAYKSMQSVGQSVTFPTLTRMARSWYFPHLAFSVTRFYNNLQLE